MTATAAGVRPEVAQRRASDPAASAWVGASAGTGKTRVLTDRVLRLLLGGTASGRILCITFTKAAAAEMAVRINRRLARWATADEAALDGDLADLGERPRTDLRARARRLFAEVLESPEGVRIQTIHAFCQSILRRFPLEAGLSPSFELMDDRTAAERLGAARDRALAAPGPDLADALGRLAALVTEDAFDDRLGEIIRERGRVGRLVERLGGIDGLAAAVRSVLGLNAAESAASIVAASCRDDAFDATGLRAAAAALATGKASDQARGRTIAGWLASPAERAARFDDYCSAFHTQSGEIRKSLATKAVSAAAPDAVAALEAEAARLIPIVERRNAAVIAEATDALLRVGVTVLDAYRTEKDRRSLLDYDDLILRTGALLERARMSAWVLYKLDGGIDHVLVDEAQDTNPDQWRVIAALTGEFFAGAGAREDHRTIFAVGDEKQSIYGFQRADPAAFRQMRDMFAGAAQAVTHELRPVALDASFRSTPAVLTFVDTLFADPEARDGVVDDPADPVRHRPVRREDGGLVELWPLIGPSDAPATTPWTAPVTQTLAVDPKVSLARRIAARIRDWLKTGDVVGSLGRPLRAGDILVLVRTRDAFFGALVRALKDRGVPVSGVDRMVLTEQLAAQDLLALIQFALLPEDDLTLAALLKGPLIGLSEDDLFALAHGRSGSLWEALADRAEPHFRNAHAYLAEKLAAADFATPYDFLATALTAPCPGDAVSGRRALLARLGTDAADPIDELVNLALGFETLATPSLQGFLHWVEAGETQIKRELEGDHRDQVRIMTVHGAKGLQAPVVILPDTASVPLSGPAILWGDSDTDPPLWPPRRGFEEAVCTDRRRTANRRRDQEYRRLLYVAVTRAADRLYIAGYHGSRGPAKGCWYDLCRQAMTGLDGVQTVAADDGSETMQRYEVPQRRAVVAAAAAPPTGAAALPDWARRPPPPEPDPPRPLVPSRPVYADPPVRSPLASRPDRRFRRGLVIHTLLQRLPDIPAGERERVAATYLRRAAPDLPESERRALATEVMAVLTDPQISPLFGPGSRAEVPIVGMIGNRRLSGQVDRLVVDDTGVLVADFKTNRPPPLDAAQTPPAYLAQMAAYRAALGRIYPGRAVRCVLIWTDGPRAMPLADDILDRWAP